MTVMWSFPPRNIPQHYHRGNSLKSRFNHFLSTWLDCSAHNSSYIWLACKSEDCFSEIDLKGYTALGCLFTYVSHIPLYSVPISNPAVNLPGHSEPGTCSLKWQQDGVTVLFAVCDVTITYRFRLLFKCPPTLSALQARILFITVSQTDS